MRVITPLSGISTVSALASVTRLPVGNTFSRERAGPPQEVHSYQGRIREDGGLEFEFDLIDGRRVIIYEAQPFHFANAECEVGKPSSGRPAAATFYYQAKTNGPTECLQFEVDAATARNLTERRYRADEILPFTATVHREGNSRVLTARDAEGVVYRGVSVRLPVRSRDLGSYVSIASIRVRGNEGFLVLEGSRRLKTGNPPRLIHSAERVREIARIDPMVVGGLFSHGEIFRIEEGQTRAEAPEPSSTGWFARFFSRRQRPT